MDFLHLNTGYYYALPTQIGNHNYDYALNNYINSKSILPDQPVQSYLISGDYILKSGADKIAAGFSFVNKKLLASPLNDNEFTTTIAYHKIYREYKFHAAMQPSVFYRSLNTSSLLFPDQYDRETGGFNAGIATAETSLPGKTRLGFNISGGIAATRYFSRFYTSLGISIRNVLPTQSSATHLEVPQYFQFIVSSQSNYFLTSNQVLQPVLIYSQSSYVNELFVGSDIQHNLGINNFKVSAVSTGVYTALRSKKYPNDFVWNVALQIKKIQLGFSYAFNLWSSKQKISSFNTYEISIGILGINQLIETYSIPCEIY